MKKKYQIPFIIIHLVKNFRDITFFTLPWYLKMQFSRMPLIHNPFYCWGYCHVGKMSVSGYSETAIDVSNRVAELLLSRETRRTLAQLRTNKSPLLVSYLFSIGDPRHPSPLCPLCLMHDHISSHLFECKSLPTSLSSLDLWTNPDKVEPFLATWGERLLAATWFGCWTLLAARWWSGVDNNNNNNVSNRAASVCCAIHSALRQPSQL